MILEIYDDYTIGKIVLIDEINAFTSLRWRRKLLEPGEVEIHLFPTSRNIQAFKIGRMVLRSDAREGCIVHDVVLSDDDLVISGRMLSHILKDRVTYPAFLFSGKAEIGMRELVARYGIGTIPMLKLGALNGFQEKVELQATGKDLLTTLIAMSKASLVSFLIRPDVENNALYFETYKGTDRTDPVKTEQTVEFCTENKNIENAIMETHDGNFYNFAYIAGEGEGAARMIETVDECAGAYRHEMWVDARDLQKGDLTPALYIELLKRRGHEKLAECKVLQSFSADVVSRGGSEYKTDWDLGDTVAIIRKEWGVGTSDIITEVEEVFEGASEFPTITPTLGRPLPETISLGE